MHKDIHAFAKVVKFDGDQLLAAMLDFNSSPPQEWAVGMATIRRFANHCSSSVVGATEKFEWPKETERLLQIGAMILKPFDIAVGGRGMSDTFGLAQRDQGGGLQPAVGFHMAIGKG